MKVGEVIVNDQPGNRCFGCSPRNPKGLRMRFVRAGEAVIEANHTLENDFCGYGPVAHGGIQATLLDEVMGMAVLEPLREEEKKYRIATAEISLRYRRPVPTDEPITVRGKLVKKDDKNLYAEGSILNADGEVLTTATSRWRMIDSPKK